MNLNYTRPVLYSISASKCFDFNAVNNTFLGSSMCASRELIIIIIIIIIIMTMTMAMTMTMTMTIMMIYILSVISLTLQ